MAELPRNQNDRPDRFSEHIPPTTAAPRPEPTDSTHAHFADFIVRPGSRPEPVSHGRLLDALIRLSTDPKKETRGVALEQLYLLSSRAADASGLRAEMATYLPALTEAVRSTNQPGVTSDVIRVAAAFALATAPGRCGAPRQSSAEPSRAGIDLLGAIAAKLYEPFSDTDAAIAEHATCALAQLAPLYNVDVAPLVAGLETCFPRNMRLSHACQEITRSAEALAHTTEAPPAKRGLQHWLRSPNTRLSWRSMESDAVSTIIRAHNTPKNSPASSPAWTKSLEREYRSLEEAIETLGRFGTRQRDPICPQDAFRATIALTTCINHPDLGVKAIKAIEAYGGEALPCLPALLEIVQSPGYPPDIRGQALDLGRGILNYHPAVSLDSTTPGLGSRYIETVGSALRSDAPELILAGLRAAQHLGVRGREFISAIETILQADIAHTSQSDEDDDITLSAVALGSLEALAVIDSSGQALADVLERVYKDDQIEYLVHSDLVTALGVMLEQERVELSIGDAVFAKLLASCDLDVQFLNDISETVSIFERTLSLTPADIPLISVALLRSKIDPDEKHDLLQRLDRGALSNPLATRQILMQAYPAISREPRLDYTALETLRRLP